MLRALRAPSITPITLGVAAALLTADLAPAGDYRFEETRKVEEGASLVVRVKHGYVFIEGWDRDEVRILASQEERDQISLRELRNILVVTARSDCGDCDELDLDITVPHWMDVAVEGHSVELETAGLESDIDAELIDGDITVDGGKGRIKLRSLQGEIRVEHAEGRIDVASNKDNVTILDCTGQIIAEAVNGDIRIAGVDTDNVEAISFNGDVLFDGSIHPQGDYYFSTHEGDITVGVPADSDLSVTVVTERGELHSDFDMRVVPGSRPGRLEFVLGEGRGKLRIETFSGEVYLFDPKKGRRKKD